MFSLALYAGWILVLLLAIAGWRTVLTLTGQRPANQFLVDGTDISPLAHRLSRAHANCYEHIPIAAGLLVAAEVSGHAAVTDPWAMGLVAARIAQSLVHIASTSVPAVVVRFGFFSLQLAIEAWWLIQLVQIGLGTP